MAKTCRDRIMIYRWCVVVLCIFFAAAGIYFYLEPVNTLDPKTSSYRLVNKPCWFDAPWQETIQCAELHTPENLGKFKLAVVIIKDGSANRHADPLVYLAGGPGASSRLHTEGIKSWLQWMTHANLGRDLILMDPRGTGRSSPQLQCAAYNRFNQALMRLSLPLAEELEQSFLVTKRCFEQLAEGNVPIDTAFFGTVMSAMDVRGLMSQLPYAEWNLLGVSYGTRLALEIAHQEVAHQQAASPQKTRLRSMVLDSVYPAGYGGVQTWPKVLDAAFHQFFQQCVSNAACMAPLHEMKNKDLTQLFMQTMELLREQPYELSIRRWDGEVPVDFVVNDHRFLSASFAAIYDPFTWPDITSAIYAVHKNQPKEIEPLIEPFINNSFSPDFNSLAFMAVDCADNPILAEQDYLAKVNEYPLLGEFTKDQWRYQICQVLPVNKNLFLSLKEPKVPTLMLSGKLDPITPVGWAGELKKQWPELQIQIREKIAHAVLSSDACVLSHLGEFFNNPQQPFHECKLDADVKTVTIK